MSEEISERIRKLEEMIEDLKKKQSSNKCEAEGSVKKDDKKVKNNVMKPINPVYIGNGHKF